jgi:hypothetical protein
MTGIMEGEKKQKQFSLKEKNTLQEADRGMKKVVANQPIDTAYTSEIQR